MSRWKNTVGLNVNIGKYLLTNTHIVSDGDELVVTHEREAERGKRDGDELGDFQILVETCL